MKYAFAFFSSHYAFFHLSGVGLLLLALLVLSVGCNGKPTTSTAEANKIQLQLNWLSDAQHGGFYAAAAQGLYAAEGLDVEIVPGGPGTAVLPKVAMGRCEFAIANADQVLLARAQQADVVAVFAAMQNSPRCIMVHAKSGITSLDQLENVTLAIGDGKAFAEFLKMRVPLNNVRIVSYSGSVAKFLVDEDFAQQGYVFSEPITAASLGGDPLALMVSDLGFNPYSSVVVTRRELWDENPELVRRFVRATHAGWASYLKSPGVANEAIAKANPEMDVDTLARSAAAIRKLCLPSGSDAGLGTMSRARWQTLRRQLIEMSLLPPTIPASGDAFVDVGE